MIKIKVQLFGGRGVGSTRIRIVRGFPTTLNQDQQKKHWAWHNNYIPGRSRVILTASELQKLINQYSGQKSNHWITPNKERINFGKPIGYWRDTKTGKEYETSWGILHYSKKGPHVIPANPHQY